MFFSVVALTVILCCNILWVFVSLVHLMQEGQKMSFLYFHSLDHYKCQQYTYQKMCYFVDPLFVLWFDSFLFLMALTDTKL